ncbi:hypothetical protein [Kluyvera intermedia]|uniref:hypothetical protein n=1 Tax=Kluyvera intermedia TaxID=61648 RepID=UPI00370AB474
MQPQSKLLFAFPVVKKEDMTPSYLTTPCEFFSGVKSGTKQSVMVTFGVLASLLQPISVLMSVNRMGEPNPLDLPGDESFYQNLRLNLLPDGKGVYLVSMEVRNVLFDGDGLYEIEAKIFPSGAALDESNVIDSIKSSFYVITDKG